MGTVTVAFVTLFLSLVSGPHSVEVAVSGPAAAVEIRIDGEVAGTMRGEPWQLKVDFGALRPLTLAAVVLDAAGNEVAATHQLVNMPRPLVESSIILGTAPDG